jgi:tetratricopeptide (TPR) repeat protein/tRNA A-37 threonylcarbamoyl transferase component Bud32
MAIDREKVQDLLQQLLNVDPDQQLQFLKEACQSDNELLQHLLNHLAAYQERTSELNANQGAKPEATIDSQPKMVVTVDSKARADADSTADFTVKTAANVTIHERFVLERKIGEGGMGEVWIAKQLAPFKRKVALKLIKSGMDSRAVLARFEQERQALAMMDHPNIARVLDGGLTSNGQPFFVMELVDGQPLTKFADTARLTTAQRLELFIPICNAVQHAHQKGIIHRDLKPANILVAMVDGKPVPKIIDFGVAKATGGNLVDRDIETQFGAVIGTLEYMAPEQAGVAGLDIDTRADIYSLGVVLYELMTGLRPIDRSRLRDAGLAEMIRVIREDDPSKPSTRLSTNEALPSLAAVRQIDPRRLTAMLKGELDWVVMKCLEKSRERRYETANGLARDIQRFLSGETVEARPASTGYRVSKFVRRNRRPIAAAGLLLLSLVAGLCGTLYEMVRAQQATANFQIAKNEAEEKQKLAERESDRADRQRLRAELREQEAIKAVKRFGEVVAESQELKNSPRLEQLRKTLLGEPLSFFRSLRDTLENDNDSRPESLAQLGQVASNLGGLTSAIGDKQNAIKAFMNANEIFEKLLKENPKDKFLRSNLATNLSNLGRLWRETGESVQAKTANAESQKLWKQLADEFPTESHFRNSEASVLMNTAVLLREQGKHDEAMTKLKQAIDIREPLRTVSPDDLQIALDQANSFMNLGLLLGDGNRIDEAIKSFEQAQKVLLQHNSQNLTNDELKIILANNYINLGRFHSEAKRDADSLASYESAVAILKILTESNPTNTDYQNSFGMVYNNIGALYSRAGKSEQALEANRESARVRERLVRDNPTNIDFRSALANSYTNSGLVLKQMGRVDEALKSFDQASEMLEELIADNPTVPKYHHALGALFNNKATLKIDRNELNDAREDLTAAIQHQKIALASNPLHPAYRRFLQNHYLNLQVVADETGDDNLVKLVDYGLFELNKNDPRFVELDQRMAALSDGSTKVDAAEYISFAKRCYDIRKHQAAAHWYEKAFASEPTLMVDRTTQHAYNAACSATLAATSDSIEEEPIDDARRKKLRAQAHSWLRAELDQWLEWSKSADKVQQNEFVSTLEHWKTDRDLSGIRDESSLEKLDHGEQAELKTFWNEVEDAIQQNRPK